MNLYLRLLVVLVKALFAPRRGALEPARLRLRVWPHDCDANLHLNNGRYLAFMDLGRLYLLGQAGMLGALARRHWAPVLSGVEVSFIRPIAPLARVAIETRLLSWDEKYFYVTQRFECRGRLCAVATVKGLFVSRGARIASRDVIAALGIGIEAPPLPAHVQRWNALLDAKKNAMQGTAA